jgi:hypothetical protein
MSNPTLRRKSALADNIQPSRPKSRFLARKCLKIKWPKGSWVCDPRRAVHDSLLPANRGSQDSVADVHEGMRIRPLNPNCRMCCGHRGGAAMIGWARVMDDNPICYQNNHRNEALGGYSDLLGPLAGDRLRVPSVAPSFQDGSG